MKNERNKIEIAKINEKIDGLSKRVENFIIERFDRFVDNDFKHLNNKVNKILWTIIIGFLISILLILIPRII